MADISEITGEKVKSEVTQKEEVKETVSSAETKVENEQKAVEVSHSDEKVVPTETEHKVAENKQEEPKHEEGKQEHKKHKKEKKEKKQKTEAVETKKEESKNEEKHEESKKVEGKEEVKEEVKEEKNEETKEPAPTRPRSLSSAELKKQAHDNKQTKLSFIEKQSADVEGAPEVKGEGKPRKLTKVAEFVDPSIQTLYDSFEHTVSTYGDKDAFGFKVSEKDKSFKFLTYKQTAQRAKEFASGLIHLGFSPKSRVGIYSKNRLEWMLTEIACNSQSMTLIAIYDTFGEDSIAYVLNHAELEVVVSATWKETTSKLVTVADKCKKLKILIQMETPTEEQKTQAAEKGLKLYSFEEVEQFGKDAPKEATPPKAEDISVIMYTSGTTGDPKGVIHTHRSVLATVHGVSPLFGGVTTADRYLSYLPLAHIFERVCMAAMLRYGATVAF